jgi:MFS family permease
MEELKENNADFKKSDFSSDKKIIDQIFNNYGYGWINLKIFILSFSILMMEGLHMTFYNSLLIPMKNFFSMKDSEVQLVTSVYFLGVGLGSLSVGYVTEKFRRVKMVNTCQLIIFISHLLLGINDNLIVFATLRIIIGMCIGIIVPIAINLLTEYLPIKNRSAVLTSVWFGYSFGQSFLLVFILVIMPNYEVAQFKNTILVSSSITFISLILCFIFLKDSPRNLILNHEVKEAVEILEKLNGSHINDIDRERIIQEDLRGINKIESVGIKEIFTGQNMLLTTTLLVIIWLLNSILFYGPNLIASLTMKTIGINEAAKANRAIIIDQIWIAIISSSSNAIGGLLSEISWLGRNKTTNLSLIVGIVFNVLIVLFPKNYNILFGLFTTATSIAFNVNTSYSCEIYTTKIRDLAIGFLFFATRIGGFVSQIIYIALNNWDTWAPYHANTIFFVLNIIIVFLLPIETYYRPLDEELETTDNTFTEEESHLIKKVE